MADILNVALIDDDEAILDSLQLYLRRKSFAVSCYRSAKSFLDALDAGAAFDCIVSDVKMPGFSGLDLQRSLGNRSERIPLVLITAHGDVDMAVSTIKAGAYDFIEKPVDGRRLAASVSEAVKWSRERLVDERQIAILRRRFGELSERQQQVVSLAVQGLSNKEIAARLSLSPRTVEHYRESAMERMQAGSLAELVHMAVRLKILRPPRA
jgi:two-component system, LuxR family, response regulator FixJ